MNEKHYKFLGTLYGEPILFETPGDMDADEERALIEAACKEFNKMYNVYTDYRHGLLVRPKKSWWDWWPFCRHFVLKDRNCPYCTNDPT